MWQLNELKGVVHVMVAGPAPGPSERQRLARAATGVQVIGFPADDRRLVELLMETMPHVHIQDETMVDFGFIDRSRVLETLFVSSEAVEAPTFRHAGRLVAFSGPTARSWEGVLAVPSITDVTLQGDGLDWVKRSSWHLESLGLWGNRADLAVIDVPQIRGLRSLYIADAGRVELGAIGSLPNLVRLVVRDVDTVVAPYEWRPAPGALEFFLADTSEVEGADRLERVAFRKVVINGRSPDFGAEFYRRVTATAPGRWVFPPYLARKYKRATMSSVSAVESEPRPKSSLEPKALDGLIPLVALDSDCRSRNLLAEVIEIVVQLAREVDTRKPRDFDEFRALTRIAVLRLNVLDASLEDDQEGIGTTMREAILSDFQLIARAAGFADADSDDLAAEREW